MAEHRLLVPVERRVALRADIDARREAKRADDAPGAGEGRLARIVRRGGGEVVQRGGARLEELRIGGLAAEAEGQLGDDGRAGEPR
jgi:hypothetical protein